MENRKVNLNGEVKQNLYRKDLLPQDTIDWIKAILINNNIEVIEVNQHTCEKKKFFSTH